MQLASRRIYTGRVVRLDVDTVRFPDGSTGELELVRHPGAAAVVPCASDPHGEDPTILMIKQYRYAAGGPLWEEIGEHTSELQSRETISYAVFCLKKKKKLQASLCQAISPPLNDNLHITLSCT